MDPNGGKESIDGDDDDDDDDDETDWFGDDYFSDEDEESHSNATDNVWSLSTNGESPCHVMRRLGQQEGDKDINDYKERASLVHVHMGSMALCRGERGDASGNQEQFSSSDRASL